jgi:para-aminobenzoate synthetase component 1
MRQTSTRHIADPGFRTKLLAWAQQFREVLFLDSNDYPQAYGEFDAVLAVDAFTSIKTDFHGAFDDLREYQKHAADWIFGYLSYDLKNDVEELASGNPDGLCFPDLFFFQPKKLFLLKGETLEMLYLTSCSDEMESDLEAVSSMDLPGPVSQKTEIIQRISRESYLAKVSEMQRRIMLGDIYEANFCMEFFAENAAIDPVSAYRKLNAISTPPFAAFFRRQDQFAMCASPERFLKKSGAKVISQPIKGTARRSADPNEDAQIKAALQRNEKERAENVMIVDLVRNDLSRTAADGSVKVEELCGIHTFRQVHHLVSTVVSQSGAQPADIIKSAFPMGSMTGAPKISAMRIIESLEETRRGLYSGAIGYFTPSGDFDFNVVIRSILYDRQRRYVSFSVGSAITAMAEPAREYDECLLKAKAMREVLS